MKFPKKPSLGRQKFSPFSPLEGKRRKISEKIELREFSGRSSESSNLLRALCKFKFSLFSLLIYNTLVHERTLFLQVFLAPRVCPNASEELAFICFFLHVFCIAFVKFVSFWVICVSV